MKVLLVLTIWLIVHYVSGQMSEKQLQAAGKLIRNVCQPKLKVTNEQIDAIHKGVFDENPDVMCYTECTLRMGKLIKDNKLDYESAQKQLQAIPEQRKEPTRTTMNNCKATGSSDDKCTAAYELYKCLYSDNPGNFFLP